jgi:hypothetical protein
MAKNSHLIEARYVGPTDTRSSRVRLFSHRFERDSVTEGYNHDFRDTGDQAAAMLETLGYTIECQGEARHGYFFVVSEFIPLRDAAAKLRKSRKHGEG